VAGSETREAHRARPWQLATKRGARAAAVALFALLLCGTAIAQADIGTIGAIGVNDIRSDGILVPNDNWNGPGDLSLASGIGVQLYRARIQLNCVDPNHSGNFDFTDPSSACGGISYDQLVGALADRGMTLLPILINLPGGIAVPPTVDGANGSPTISEFAAFAAAAAARYGPDGSFWPTCGCSPQPIQAWEIWNEENNGYWWGGDASASAYATVFDATRIALRGVDPLARVVVGGLTYAPNGDPSFVAPAQMIHTLAAGNANAFDAVAVHPYSDAVGATSAQLAQSAMDYVNETAQAVEAATGPSASGAPRQQIWITEMGWSDTDNTPATIAAGFQDFITDINDGARSADNIGPVLWYMLRDNSTISQRDDALGLRYTNSDGGDAGPKPIWSVFATVAQQAGTIPLPPALSDSGPYVAPPIATVATKHGATAGAHGHKKATKKAAARCAAAKRNGRREKGCKATTKKRHHRRARRADHRRAARADKSSR
jgi:hypothetical protein